MPKSLLFQKLSPTHTLGVLQKQSPFPSALPTPETSASHKVPVPNLCCPRASQSSNSPAIPKSQLPASPTPAAGPKASGTPAFPPHLSHHFPHQALSSPGFLKPHNTPHNPAPQTCHLTAPFTPSRVYPCLPPSKSSHQLPSPPGLPTWSSLSHLCSLTPSFPTPPSPCYVLPTQRVLPASIPATHFSYDADSPDIPIGADPQLPPPDETPQPPFPAHTFSERVILGEIPINNDFTEILGVWKGFRNRKIKSVALILFLAASLRDLTRD